MNFSAVNTLNAAFSKIFSVESLELHCDLRGVPLVIEIEIDFKCSCVCIRID